MQHPDHEQLTETVRGWYRFSAPEMGYIKEPRRFGIYGRNLQAPDGRGNEVLVQDLHPADVSAFMHDVRAYYAGASVRIHLDDRAKDEELRPSLLEEGCLAGSAQSYLAHVGAIPVAPPVAGLTVELVDEASLEAFAVTKLKGFANSEQEPSPSIVHAELAARRVELADVGRFWLARIEGQPAAVLAWYEDVDRFIYNVATRISFRQRGIVRWLLCELLRQSYERKCRSIIINADTDGRPIHLYRSVGFADEVYWRSRYDLRALMSSEREGK